MIDRKECKCTQCGREYVYDSKSKKGHTLDFCNSCNVNYRRFEVMKKCLEYKGNKCQECGYNKCSRALCFHHLDPSQKSFTISGRYCLSWKNMQKELDKCILVCANCHAEIHYKNDHAKELELVRHKNPLKYFVISCAVCEKEFYPYRKNRKYCSRDCQITDTQSPNKPDKETLSKLMEEYPMVAIAKMYGVSDKTIKKWSLK